MPFQKKSIETSECSSRKIWGLHSLYCAGLLLIAVATFAGYFRYAPIHDFINEFFPGRYFVIDCIRNGRFPLWCPYQSMGIPAHADPQAGVFYLPAWLFAIFGSYTSICCAIEYILHLFIGGMGFYFLAHSFTKCKPASFIIGVCYMLSGFFIANGQHLSWIIAGAWLPWVLWGIISLFENPCTNAAIRLSVPTSLMLTGGYPGFVFILAYLIIILTVSYFVKYRKDWRQIKRILLYGSISAGLFLLLSSSAIISFIEAKMYITRGDSLGYGRVALPVTLRSMVSVAFPYVTCSSPEFTHTDISMGSIFIGIFTWLMFLIGCKNVKNSILWVISGFGLWALLCAFGPALPIHKIAFLTLPFISFIQIASIFRIFFLIPVLLVAAHGLSALFNAPTRFRKPLIIGGSAVAILFLACCLALLGLKRNFLTTGDLAHLDLAQKLMPDAIMGLAISVAFVLAMFLKEKRLWMGIAVVFVADMAVHASVCAPQTVHDSVKTHRDLACVTSVRGYPVPDSLTTPEKIVSEREWFSIWMNAGCFAKEVEVYSWNPFRMESQGKIISFYSDHEKTLELPIAFFPTTIVGDTAAHFLNADTAYTLTDCNTVIYNGNAKVNITEFAPGRIVVETENEEARPLVICQNLYPGWRAETGNGENIAIKPLNHFMLSVDVPRGKHQITLQYRRPALVALFIVEVLTFLVCMAIAFLKKRNFAASKNNIRNE